MKLKLSILTLICTTMLTSAAMAERKSWVSKFANSIKNIGQSSDQSNTLKVEAISQLSDAANAKADYIENSLVDGRWKYLELDLGATRNDDNKNKGSVSVKSCSWGAFGPPTPSSCRSSLFLHPLHFPS